MPETYTPVTAVTGTWTEEEIRQQPASWIRSLTNIDNIRSAIDSFLAPLLRKNDLRIILTGAGTSAFIGDIIAPWLASYTGKNISAVPTTDLVTNPMDYLNPAHPLLLISFARSGNSPESVAAVELANQFVPECYHLPITCNEAGSLYQNAVASDNAFALLMPAETHDRGFAMTSSITTMMASCLAVFAPETINSHTFRDVADRCQAILTALGVDGAAGNMEGKETRFGGERVFAVPLPKSLLRLQRREVFRLALPSAKPYTCRIRRGKPDEILLPMHDLSIGGIGIHAQQELDYSPLEKLENCWLDLGDSGMLQVTLEVRYLRPLESRSGKPLWHLGCRFVDLPPAAETQIQRFMARIEAERRALSGG